MLLCSVPPAQANYLQRVGRAGRKTGNALATTVAGGRPHDLNFWASPRAMLAGNVDTPGVFLNASAVLERQLTAVTLECWVRELGEKAKVPAKLNDALSAVRNQTQSKFPYPWLTYIDQNRATLLAEFVEIFGAAGEGLTAESRAYLETFIEGGGGEGTLSWKIVNRLQGVIKDIDDLKSRFGMQSVDIAMPSHMHDDHLNGFPHLIRNYGTKIWCYENMLDVLENPRGYNLGCILGEPFEVRSNTGGSEEGGLTVAALSQNERDIFFDDPTTTRADMNGEIILLIAFEIVFFIWQTAVG